MRDLKILHATDIHCRLDNLEALTDKERESFDVLVLTGDFCCNSKLTRILKNVGRPVYAVTGNMDDTHIARILRDNGWLMDGRVVVTGKTVYAGIGGLQPVFDSERVSEALLRIDTNGKMLIMLAHHPIHGFLDVTYMGVHAGLYETRRLVEKFKPVVYLHGHIHEARGTARLGDTLLVNPGPLAEGHYAIVEVDKDGSARAWLYTL